MEICFTETYKLEEIHSHQSFDTAGICVTKILGSILQLFLAFPSFTFFKITAESWLEKKKKEMYTYFFLCKYLLLTQIA